MSAELDYYEILSVPRSATKVEICKAYKKLALQYHPSLKHENESESYKKFCLISEAFDILYSDIKRKVYDEHGEQKLKEGIINKLGERELGEYTLTTNPEVVFEKFFGSKNVFEHLLTVVEGDGRSHPVFSSQYGVEKEDTHVDDLVIDVDCRLSEIFNGVKKTLTYDKRILTADGQSTKIISETKTIEINPGRAISNPIVYPEQGNQEPGYHSSNLVFKIKEIEELGFKRSSDNPDDIIYTANISLIDALDSVSIEVKELSGEIIQLHFDEVISPQLVRTVEGKGMPKQNGQGRGNLFVKFNISFPEEIDIEKKARIVELLRAAQ